MFFTSKERQDMHKQMFEFSSRTDKFEKDLQTMFNCYWKLALEVENIKKKFPHGAKLDGNPKKKPGPKGPRKVKGGKNV